MSTTDNNTRLAKKLSSSIAGSFFRIPEKVENLILAAGV
jgi:hypothetical protein